MANQQGQAFEDLRNTISECTRIVRHRWRLAVMGLSVVASIGFWGSQQVPREYSASTMFERRDDAVLQNLVRKNSPYSFDHLKTTLALDMTGSRALARAVVAAGFLPADAFTGSAALTEAERNALDRVAGRYKLQPSVKLIHSTESLDTILLKCTANDPTVARKMVVALRDEYIAETRDRIREILVGTQEFFAAEIKRMQQQVVEAEASLRKSFDEFQGVDPTDLAAMGNRLEVLRGQHNEVFQRKAALDAEVTAREGFLSQPPPAYATELTAAETSTGSGGSKEPGRLPATKTVSTTIDRAVENVQQEIVDALTVRRMTEEHPTVKGLYSRLETLRGLQTALRDAVTSPVALQPAVAEPPPPPVVTESYRQWQAQQMRVELELDSLRRQQEIAGQQLTEAGDRLQRFEQLYNRLLKDDDGLRAVLDKRAEGNSELAVWQNHLSQLERVLAAESGERGTQFTLIEEPQDSFAPVKPRVASIFVVCSGLGLAAAGLLVAMAELFDRSFRSVGQVTRALGIPVLECIGVVPTPRERRRAMVSRLVWTPALGLLVLILMTSAALAYASLAMPAVHQRALQRMDRALGAFGAVPVVLEDDRPT